MKKRNCDLYTDYRDALSAWKQRFRKHLDGTNYFRFISWLFEPAI